MKRVLVFVTAVCSLVTIASCAIKDILPEPSYNFYANDVSNVISKSVEEKIIAQGVALEKATGAQIVVATVPGTDGYSLEEYSLELARSWGIGDASKDNGVLILFTTDEAHVRIDVGYGLEGALNDAKCGRILDTWAVDSMHAGLWDEAALNTWNAVAEQVYAEYGLEVPEDVKLQWDINEEEEPSTLEVISMIFIFIVVLIISCCMRSGRGRGGGWYSGGWYSGGGFGRSGGGGFSGGGGSFGGGGASR